MSLARGDAGTVHPGSALSLELTGGAKVLLGLALWEEREVTAG